MLGIIGEELGADAPVDSPAFFAHMANSAALENDPVRRQLLSRPSTFYEPRASSGFVGLDNQSVFHLLYLFRSTHFFQFISFSQRRHMLPQLAFANVFHDCGAEK